MDHSKSMTRLAEAEKKDGEPSDPDAPKKERPPSDGTKTPAKSAPTEPGSETPSDPAQNLKSRTDKKDPKAVVEQPDPKPVDSMWASSISEPYYSALLVIAGALLATAACVAFVATRMKSRERNTVDIAALSVDIATALHKPGLPLKQVADEIRLIETQTAKLVTAYETLNVSSTKAAQKASDPLRQRVNAVVVFLDDAILTAAALAGDAEFARVDQVLSLQSGLQTAAKELKEATDGEAMAARLLAILERGSLNAPLTASLFLDAYFPNHRAWRSLRTALRASEAALQVLLERNGVQIVTTPILSIVSASDIREPPTTDIRNVKRIPEVQQIAARMARNLGSREILIVDCHTPGWISDKLGRRPPQFTVFDPTSWT